MVNAGSWVGVFGWEAMTLAISVEVRVRAWREARFVHARPHGRAWRPRASDDTGEGLARARKVGE